MPHKNTLAKHIVHTIQQNGGWMSFSDYMQAALYAPNAGYYTNPDLVFGHDFVTAPEISALFSQTIAQSILPSLGKSKQNNILEFGAGRGTMAVDILIFLEDANSLPNKYIIVELSQHLQKTQKHTIQERIPHLAHKVTWQNEMPGGFEGIVLANELFDALPAERFIIQNQTVSQLGVGLNKKQQLQYTIGNPLSLALPHALADYPEGYHSEFCPLAETFLTMISQKLKQGVVLIIDYGYEDFEYFHPERDRGTLKCFFEHRHHDDPFIHIGKQDISTHVHFSRLAEVAECTGLEINAFETQAQFLLAHGITVLAEKENLDDMQTRLKTSQAIQKLTLPGQMGDVIKVLTLSKSNKNDTV